MKKYQKPAMLELSITANNQLCGGCEIGTRNDPRYKDLDSIVGNNDGLFTEKEAEAIGLFGTNEGCEKPYEQYCKFTSNGNLSLFTS